MNHHPSYRALLALLALLGASDAATLAQSEGRRALNVTIRPSTLTDHIEELAGSSVRVPYARVVGVFNPQVLVVETASPLPPPMGHRDRLLVLVEARTLNVAPKLIVGETVIVVGVARTILGVQVTREVPWPEELRPELVKRLELRAAVLARSVQTAEGVELTVAATDRQAEPRIPNH